ncbi:MAG TPA: hypothetical protein VNT57_06430 [Desulfobacteria bacterium]|nr:hypothetical protein [Desulfobacteria bacterium]
MAFLNNNSRSTAYDEVIRQIKGVISAKVVTNSSGEILEIHVLAGSERSPKQVVRDIESVIMVNHDISIDHKKISVAQLRDGGAESFGDGRSLSNGFNQRPKIAGVTMISGGRIVEAKVLLDVGGKQFEGFAAGPGTSSNKLRLISQATLSALENTLEGNGNFLIEDVSIIPISGSHAVIASVALITNSGEERLIGAAFVNSDEREASVKATLAAVNRRMDMFFNN